MNTLLSNSVYNKKHHRKQNNSFTINRKTFVTILSVVPIVQTCVAIACIIHILHFLSDPAKIHNYQNTNDTNK